MKRILMTLSSLYCLNLSSAFAADCQSVAVWGQGERYDCHTTDKTFHVLKLRGNLNQIATQQAHLAPSEILEGPLGEVVESLRSDLSKGSLAARQFKRAVLDCYASRIKNSVSHEFAEGAEVFAREFIQASSGKSPYSRSEIELAQYAIELSIAAEGLSRRTEEDPLGVMAELGAVCGITLSLDLVKEIVGGLGSLSKMKLGCLGFVSPAQNNSNDQLMHARNFDANLVDSWNRHPTLFLVDEPGYYRYAAVASAGVIYPGGISGINEHGIAVSLHEMSTTQYRTSHPRRSAELTPYIQQRVLRETRTLDEALRLIQSTKAFGAWTILVSDSKTNEAASVEISGDRIQVARKVRQNSIGQSNHFLGSKMQDQFFTYSFGKDLESESRLRVIQNALEQDKGRIDLDWMIDHLAGHEDAFEGTRAFGRTAVKAYNVMSSVAIAGRNEIWFTTGNRRPAAHSDFTGFRFNFKDFSFESLGERKSNRYSHLPNWEKSLEVYVNARLLYEKNHKAEALGLLTSALQLSLHDGIDEPTYRYALGRLHLELAQPREALVHFGNLTARRKEIHDYQYALVSLYSSAALRLLQSEVARPKAIAAESLFLSFQKRRPHFDLRTKVSLAQKLKNSTLRLNEFPAIDFVTVE